MVITLKDLLILGTVIGIHVFLFVFSLLHTPQNDKNNVEVLQAELISPPPPPAPKAPPAPPTPKAPPPKLLTIAPSQKPQTSKPQEAVKPVQTQKSEPITPSKTDTSVSNESAKSPDPVAPSSTSKSNSPIGIDAGTVELNQLIMVYRPDTEIFYPRLSKDIGEQGIVDVQLYINESGEVRSVSIMRSSGYERLDKAAAQLASRIRFKPYLVNGVASKVNAGIAIKFQLNR